MLLQHIFCSNTTEKRKLEKCSLGATVWAPKSVYQSPKQPEYVTVTHRESLFDLFLLFLTIILSEPHEMKRSKNWIAEKIGTQELWSFTLLPVHTSYVTFCQFFHEPPPPYILFEWPHRYSLNDALGTKTGSGTQCHYEIVLTFDLKMVKSTGK